MPKILAALAVAGASLLLTPAALAKCSPVRTMKMVVRVDDPRLPADHFGRKAKTIYRLTEKYGRLQEEPDGAKGLHILFVVNEPDIWMVNLADKTGQHSVDPGPTFNFRAPVIPLTSEHWDNFEFGCEVPFMKAVNAPQQVDQATGATIYEHRHDGVTAQLFVAKNGIPRKVTITTKDATYSVLYDAYEQFDNADTAVFEKPSGIAFTEAER